MTHASQFFIKWHTGEEYTKIIFKIYRSISFLREYESTVNYNKNLILF